MFKRLNEQETEQFRRWARENYQPPAEINEVWHPVIQAECRRMLEESGQPLPNEASAAPIELLKQDS